MMKALAPRTLVLLVLTVIVIIFGLTVLFKPNQKPQLSYQELQPEIGLEEVFVDAESQDKLSLLKQTQKKLEEADWTNDPFAIGEGSLFLKDLSSFKLTGILLDPDGAHAVINDEVLKVGDELAGWEVIEILPNKIILKRGDEEVSLNLWEETER